jgi:hypothetical protein
MNGSPKLAGQQALENSRFKLTNQETQQEKCRMEASGWRIRMLKSRKTGRNPRVSQSGV